MTREVFYDPEKVENILAERGSAAAPRPEKQPLAAPESVVETDLFPALRNRVSEILEVT